MNTDASLGKGSAGIRFGVFVGQANKEWPQIRDEFLLAEDLGFDHAWVVDHFVNTDGPPSDPCHEAWTLLAALAVSTTRIRLGVLVSSNTFRHPALLLKEAVTVDHVSGGRVILGMGTGWHGEEHRRYGFELPEPRERVDRFEEAVQIVHSLMSQERTSFPGRHYQLDDAPLEPRPLQQPRIPILIAAHRPRMLRLAARYADVWDTFPAIPGTATEGVEDQIKRRVELLDAECRRVGRDPAEIRRSTWTGGDVAGSEARFLDFVGRHRALGFTDFSIGLPREDDRPMLRRIAAGLMPSLRKEENPPA
ncbi:MAG: TIGR03560 family F420-dependent LLM class oxidoreductase [Chloroflexi bacterium]|nr:TIGR03560 family F420-dependent LLM class oxidoreductase [Chloroflexota bacterium]